MDHLELWDMEKAWDRNDTPWNSFVDRCLKAMGETNDDGDEATDGYSLGTMHKAFQAGQSPEEYARRRHQR